jgi:hypothetical protein
VGNQRLLRTLPSVLLIGGAIVASGLSYFGEVTPATAITILLALVALVALQEVLTNQDLERAEGRIVNITTELENIHDLVGKQHGETRERLAELLNPEIAEDYVRAFSNLEGQYMVFNASLPHVTKGHGIDLLEQVYMPRFSNDSFKHARYLFFLKNPEDEENVEIFRSLFIQTVKRVGKKAESKLEVRILSATKPDIEFYIGEKSTGKVVMVNFQMPLIPRIRDYVLQMRNQVVIDQYRSLFEQSWEQAKIIPMDRFLQPSFDIESYLRTGR